MKISLVTSLILSATVTIDASQYKKKGILLYLKGDDDLCVDLRRHHGVKKGSSLDVVRCNEQAIEQCWNLKLRKDDDKAEYFRIHPCQDDDLCVQVSGADKKDKLKLRPCKNDDSQYFRYNDNGDLEISPKGDPNLCMEPKKMKKDRLIWLRKCSGKNDQAWKTGDFKGDVNGKCSKRSDKMFKKCEKAPDEKKYRWFEEYGAIYCGEFRSKWKDICIMRKSGLSCKKHRDCTSLTRPFCAKTLGICVECLKSSDCPDKGDYYCAEPGEVDDVKKYFSCQD